jgi:hypothetical protein
MDNSAPISSDSGDDGGCSPEVEDERVASQAPTREHGRLTGTTLVYVSLTPRMHRAAKLLLLENDTCGQETWQAGKPMY